MKKNHAKEIEKAMNARDVLAQKSSAVLWRQGYHFAAPAGWLNDPNGCIFYKGEYHLFYQHYPYAPVWGSMHWGHATSKDLLHWQHLPIALAPSESYDDHQNGGVFSGSAVQHNGELSLLYTAATNYGNGFVQSQCLASSTDGGITFEKSAQNPVIKHPPLGVSADFRDPRVLRHGDTWYMVLGAAMGASATEGGEGCALMYKSCDLQQWVYCGILARSANKYGSMWECPDLFFLDGKWVLTFSPMFMGQQKSVYLVGAMDFDNAKFTVENDGELDWGGEYYASQSMQDDKGRTVLMAWQNGWDWMPHWHGHGPTASEGWCGSMALPRTVRLDKQNRIVSAPVQELETLRSGKSLWADMVVNEEKSTLFDGTKTLFELQIQIDIAATTAECLHIDLRCDNDKRSRITVDFSGKKLLFDRTNADDGHSHGVRECHLCMEDDVFTLRAFSDSSSIEIFADGGKANMSNTIYPSHSKQGIFLHSKNGSTCIPLLELWDITGQAK